MSNPPPNIHHMYTMNRRLLLERTLAGAGLVALPRLVLAQDDSEAADLTFEETLSTSGSVTVDPDPGVAVAETAPQSVSVTLGLTVPGHSLLLGEFGKWFSTLNLPMTNYIGPSDPALKEISFAAGRKIWSGQLTTQYVDFDLSFKSKVAWYLSGQTSTVFTAAMGARVGVVSFGTELSMGFKFDPSKGPIEVKPAPNVVFLVGVKFK